MSKLPVVLVPRARKELKKIRRYSRQNFGAEKQEEMLAVLYAQFDRLSQYPELGAIYEDFGGGTIRSISAGPFVIYYRADSVRLVIETVRHYRQHVEEADFD
jgi:plasmid stabilization system protein ParE